MDFRNLSKEHWVSKSERGVALFTAMMSLVLVSGFAFFILQNAATEIQIANESKNEFVRSYVAESAIEQSLAWFNDPAQSPNPTFFKTHACSKNTKKASKGFFYSMDDLGETAEFRFYKSSNKLGMCTVEVRTSSGKKISVDLAVNPMPSIPEQDMASPVSIDLQLEARMIEIKRFVKRFGRYLVISPKGTLQENGIDIGTFEAVFANKNDTLVFIDFVENHSSPYPLKIGKGHYKRYFYFSGDIEIEGGESGQPDLSGFFYTQGKMILKNEFSVYGALYAGLGFEGEGVHPTKVSYNKDYEAGFFKGVLPLVPIIGTQKTM
jgi:Tfp pilus assembly protein PilX